MMILLLLLLLLLLREAPSGVSQPCRYVDIPDEDLAGERGRPHRDQYLASDIGVAAR
jgi:hypothetical protein